MNKRRGWRPPNSEANEQLTTPWVVVVVVVEGVVEVVLEVVLANRRLSASDCSALEDEAGSDRVDGGGEGGTIGRTREGVTVWRCRFTAACRLLMSDSGG